MKDKRVMMKLAGRLATTLVLVLAAMPLSASAQEQKKPEAAKAAPAARAAPQQQIQRAAPQQQIQQRAAAPQRQIQQRVAAPQQQVPQHAAAPQRQIQQRAATPQRQAPQRAAAPQGQIQQHAATPQRQAPRIANRPANTASKAAAAPVTRQSQPAGKAQQPVSAAQTRTQQRQVQRQERTLQQRENRALRALPAKQRAARQQEIMRDRTQRAQQRQVQPNGLVQPNTAVSTNAAQVRGARRNGQARVTQQAARQGRFAATFGARAQGPNALGLNASARGTRFAARQAWQHGQRAGFVPWYGPVFWPYAYSDIFDYAFWPGGYDDGYFAYAYDDFFDGVFWGEAGPPQDYVQDYADTGPSAQNNGPSAQQAARPSYASVQELCRQPGSGVTAWPVAEIDSKVGLNVEQKQLLGDVKSAGEKAAAVFKASCPSENAFPLTPPGRLSAMTSRLDATLTAVQTVRPALEQFYGSLSDEQKERFNEVGPKQAKEGVTTGQASIQESNQASVQGTNSCKEQKPGLTNLPMEKIEDAIKPTDAQEGVLKALEDATGQAVSILQAACPDETPLTPPGRLEAMEKRLQAMIEAANTVKPALGSFYASLSSEQKARFNRIGALAKSDD
jgi:hypothetical protein